jgi:hypothetical protein
MGDDEGEARARWANGPGNGSVGRHQRQRGEEQQTDSPAHGGQPTVPGSLLSQQRQERPELDLGLGQLGSRIGAGDDADASVEPGLAVAQQGAA